MSGTATTFLRSEMNKWATFVLSDEKFAVRVEDVQEVLMAQQLTPIPLAPGHIVGLLNLRGGLMSVIDLRKRLHFPPRPVRVDEDGVEDGGKLLVVKSDGRLVGLLVDDIGDVLDLPSEDWRLPPDTLGARHREFVRVICPVEGEIVMGVDVDALVGRSQEV
ncbi:MAG TPA: chemotaxis protein CheW [Planctomycetes bacterium]|nr:chemotaxis protein CheW [Planctomycetota bacterium]